MELRDLKVGDYVRTDKGRIAKIKDIYNGIADCDNWLYETYDEYIDFISLDNKGYITKDIIKASDKLIDVVEENDFINGFRVLEIMKNNRKEESSTMVYCEFGNGFIGYYNEDIKSIVTKEMFDQMSYKVGEQNETNNNRTKRRWTSYVTCK